MSSDKKTDPVEIFAGTTWEAEIVKSLLENAEIESFLIDKIIGTLYPWVTSPGGTNAVKVFVSNHDFDKAKLIVEEYKKNISNKE
ncbi:MAG: DUF2007-related protein [Tenuifilaceae bacterium]